MKETKLYICEICNTNYSDKSKCKQCEENHKKPVKIDKCKYLSYKSDNTGLPNQVTIMFDDGRCRTYYIQK